MTAKEKAEKLIDKYKGGYKNNDGFNYKFNNDYEDAKQCALIAVDELISQMLCLMKLFNEDRSEFEAIELDYLIEVKKEIEKL